jgi:CHAD domain-containing protein
VAGFLGRVETLDDAPLAHRARIRGKRLRYLLEPLRDAPGPSPARALKALKRFQELLGELNDARVAAEVLRAAGRDAGRDAGPAVRRGIATLEALSAGRAGAAFERLQVEVHRVHWKPTLEPALAVAAALEARGAPRPGSGTDERDPDPE